MSFMFNKSVNSSNNPRKRCYIQCVMAEQFDKRDV